MKFKSPSWDASSKDVAEFRQAYANHLESMRGVLPEHVLALATLPGVEDALIEEYFYNKDDYTLRLVLLCGYLQMGYYDLIINYQVAELSPEDERTLAHLAHSIDEYIQLHRFEVDITEDDQIEHRLEFFTSDENVWFAIRCEELHWERVERPKTKFSPLPARFLGGTDTE